MRQQIRRCQAKWIGSSLLLLGLCMAVPVTVQAAPQWPVHVRKPSVAPVRPSRPVTQQPRQAAIAPQFLAANTRFGFKLFAQTLKADSGKNVAVSPSSVAIALAMTYNGAQGETQKAIAQALELQGLSLETINQSNAALKAALTGADPEVQLAIANSLWGNRGVDFRPDFIQRNQAFYGAKLTILNFASPQAVSTINQWVKQNTRGKIPTIVDRLSPNQVLMLLNAIYFKGKWSQPFEKQATVERPFTVANGTQKQHPLMSQTGEYRYYETDQFQAVSLPYGQGRFSLYLFLPRPNSNLNSFYQALTPQRWEQWMTQFQSRPGSVQMPRFKLEYDINLNNALKALGMGIAFDADRADFAGMSADKLAIDQVKHKTFVEVNEEGTEAAAVTSVGIVTTSAAVPPPPFAMVVDRPFFWAIRDNQTGTLLFLGSIVDPQR